MFWPKYTDDCSNVEISSLFPLQLPVGPLLLPARKEKTEASRKKNLSFKKALKKRTL
jgi:hypothetical protein